jgi:hypothetical protein
MMTDLPDLSTYPRTANGNGNGNGIGIDNDIEEDNTQEQEQEIEVDDTAPLVEPGQDLDSFLETFWTRQMAVVERDNPDFKTYPLPLARIKKVMKSDEDVKVGLLFLVGCVDDYC